MKTKIVSVLTGVLVTFSFHAAAQDFELVSNVNVALTGKFTEELEPVVKGTRTTHRAVIRTFRLTNKDIIQAFRDAGMISDVRGWRVVAVASGEDEDDSLVLRKAGEDDIPIEVASEELGFADSFTFVEDDEAGPISGRGRWEATVNLSLSVPGLDENSMTAREVGSESLRKIRIDGEVEMILVLGARSLTVIGISGGGEGEDASVLSGRISISAQRILRLAP